MSVFASEHPTEGTSTGVSGAWVRVSDIPHEHYRTRGASLRRPPDANGADMQLVRLGLLLLVLPVCKAVEVEEAPGTDWEQYIDCDALTATRHDSRKEGRWCFEIPLQVLNAQHS